MARFATEGLCVYRFHPVRSLGAAAFGWLAAVTPTSAADVDLWPAPFGGSFNAAFTATTDYSYAGISNTQLGPAFQVNIDYRTRDLVNAFPLWLFASGFGTNMSFPATGPGVEIDIGVGVKLKAFHDKLSADIGYVRYTYPGVPATFSYDYGEIVANAGYDFEIFELKLRLRQSPNSFGNSGASWNKRALVSVPLTFLKVSDHLAFKAYGSVGNVWVDRFLQYGLPSQDYWYWQIGLVTSALGFDWTVAYTDTSIDPAGCGNTAYCSGRLFTSISKRF